MHAVMRNNLSGLWHGQFSYANSSRGATDFTATLLDRDGTLTGTTTENCPLPPNEGAALLATLHGTHENADVRFRKDYEPGDPRYRTVQYRGTVNGDGTEIEGTWSIGARNGRFLMIRQAPAETAVRRHAHITA